MACHSPEGSLRYPAMSALSCYVLDGCQDFCQRDTPPRSVADPVAGVELCIKATRPDHDMTHVDHDGRHEHQREPDVKQRFDGVKADHNQSDPGGAAKCG